ncbi:MAG: hypothetical protein WC553_01950 [Patescibacteria group bacterium]|jgi:hypothetical protein
MRQLAVILLGIALMIVAGAVMGDDNVPVPLRVVGGVLGGIAAIAVIAIILRSMFWPEDNCTGSGVISSTGFNADDARGITKTREELGRDAERVRRERIASVSGGLEYCFENSWRPGIERAAAGGQHYVQFRGVPVNEDSREEVEMMLVFLRSKGFRVDFTHSGAGESHGGASLTISWK